ncbi:MAG TPA: hypothetical protein VL022_02205 [Moheibacter sp.]|nr:hypothetical protein [Moheibacter sp.]
MENNHDSQEIDLSYLTKKTSLLLNNIGFSIFRFSRFLAKNIIVIAIIVLAGIAIGYFLDLKSENTYKHEVIVVPNFNSTSYLYNTIENIELGNSPITSVKIEPILNMYEFINDGWNNLEIAKYLSQNNIQINKYSPDSEIKDFYRYHLMTITTSKRDDKGEIIDSLLTVFNKEPYFSERQKIEVENTKSFVNNLKKSVESIDQILDKIGKSDVGSGDLNIEMYSELNNLISSKRSTLLDINKHEIHQLEEIKTIYPTSKITNIKVNKMSNTFLVPALLFGLFLFFSVIRLLFKKYNRAELMDK